MRRRVERGEAPSPAVADQHRSLGPGTVQDRAQIVCSHVEVGRPEHAIGESGASLVEQDDPGERRQALEEPNAPRGLELDLEVPRHPQRVDEIDRPVASHLVGDVHAVDRLRVAGSPGSPRRILPVDLTRGKPAPSSVDFHMNGETSSLDSQSERLSGLGHGTGLAHRNAAPGAEVDDLSRSCTSLPNATVRPDRPRHRHGPGTR